MKAAPISGQVDIEFDIGPAYYNFVDVRYIGEPRLRERIYEPSRNVTLHQQHGECDQHHLHQFHCV